MNRKQIFSRETVRLLVSRRRILHHSSWTQNTKRTVASKFPERCTYHKPDNYDSISVKKRGIGTLNMFLFYIIFTNVSDLRNFEIVILKSPSNRINAPLNTRRIGNAEKLINAAAFNRVNTVWKLNLDLSRRGL